MATQLLSRGIRRVSRAVAPLSVRQYRAVAVVPVALAIAVLGAPAAGATVAQVSVMPDLNVGIRTDYGTGCTYTVRARLSDAVTPVTFYDNGVPFATVAPAGGGVALANWVPAYEGDHTLQAAQPAVGSDGAPYVQVFVGRGAHIGYACWVI